MNRCCMCLGIRNTLIWIKLKSVWCDSSPHHFFHLLLTFLFYLFMCGLCFHTFSFAVCIRRCKEKLYCPSSLCIFIKHKLFRPNGAQPLEREFFTYISILEKGIPTCYYQVWICLFESCILFSLDMYYGWVIAGAPGLHTESDGTLKLDCNDCTEPLSLIQVKKFDLDNSL